jgi:1-acyl-sn-glycerol-3-phosphate acyltransferase
MSERNVINITTTPVSSAAKGKNYAKPVKKTGRQKARSAAPRHRLRRGPLGWLSYHIGMFLTRFLAGIHYRGRQHLPKERPYVLAANHQTFVDGMWICSGLPKEQQRHFSVVAGADLRHRYGWFGRLMLQVGRAIPIERKGGNPIRGLLAAKRRVDEGYIILVHPEGTRTHNGKLGDLQNGAGFLAMKSNVPLVPVFVHGGYELFSRHMKLPRPRDPVTGRRREIHIVFGPPFYPWEYSSLDEIMADLKIWMETQESQGLPDLDEL